MARKLHDWKAIQRYHDQGHGFVACARRFGLTHAAWRKALQRGAIGIGLAPFADRRRKYDWPEVQAYYDDDHTFSQCRQRFKFSSAAWTKAIRRGEIKPRTFDMPTEQLLSSPKRNRSHLKVRLTRAKLLENRCQGCNLTDWLGRPLSMHLDHINGVKNDHRLENLRMLCPNCHSQTATYGGRNARKRGAPIARVASERVV
jgi:5-methylcytosine-specific restriction endonuclease McrA